MNVDLDDHSIDISTWPSQPVLLFMEERRQKKKKILGHDLYYCALHSELPAKMLIAPCCVRSLVLSSDMDSHMVKWIAGFFTNKWKVPVENIKALAV